MDPAHARNQRDREHRINRRKKLFSQLIPSHVVPLESVFPGFGPYRDAAREDQIGIGLPKDAIEALVQKIVRGITYVLDGKYIEDDHKIEIFSVMRQMRGHSKRSLAASVESITEVRGF